MMVFIDGLFWWVGFSIVSGVVLGFAFIAFATVWCWFSAAYGIWKGYVMAHQAFPDSNIVSEDFRARYGDHWELVLFGALLSQYDRMMAESGGVFDTKWFSVNLRGIRPRVGLLFSPPTTHSLPDTNGDL